MKKSLLLIVSLCLLCLAVWGTKSPKPYTQREYLMDTFVSVTLYGKDAKTASSQIFDRLYELDQKLNAHKEGSFLYALNHAEAGVPFLLDDEMYMLIAKAFQMTEASDGAFDCTLLPLSALWNFGKENQKVPQEEEIKKALSHTGKNLFILDDEKKTITKKDAAAGIDLGGIAKGYAADECVRLLKKLGIENACIDLGGNIALIGEKPLSPIQSLSAGKKTTPFTVGLQAPGKSRGEVAKTLTKTDCFIVTSGDYERFFIQDGVAYHHILDPKTGMPAKSAYKSVTVVAENGMMADLLSTTLFITGPESAKKYEKDYEQVIFIDDRLTITEI